MRKFVFILFILFSTKAHGQNLIPNPSFEDTIPLAINPNQGRPDGAPPWFAPPQCGQSADYHSSMYYYPYSSVPLSIFGFQYARTGIAYCGFGVYSSFSSSAREKISCILPSPLIANHKYYLEFYVSCADFSDDAIDVLGAYFSVDTPDFCLGFVFTPQVFNPPGIILSDTVYWQKVSGTFTAQGGEQVITFTNFFPDSLTQIYNFPNGTNGIAYYYIDDVFLIDSTLAGVSETISITLLMANPVSDQIIFSSNEPINEAALFNSLGEIILSKSFETAGIAYEFNVATLPPGIYLLRVTGKKNNVGIKKILKL